MDRYKVIAKETYLNLLVFSDFLFMVSLVHEMNTGETWNYEPSHFCGNFACLGKSWYTEWQFRNSQLSQ